MFLDSRAVWTTRRYRNYKALEDFCRQVAGSLGRVVGVQAGWAFLPLEKLAGKSRGRAGRFAAVCNLLVNCA